MSVVVSSWVWQHSQSRGIDRLVLLAIADSAEDDGDNAWPSVFKLARKAGVDERTAQRAVMRLVKLGELGVRLGAGKNGVNVYRVIMVRQSATPGATPPRRNAPPSTNHPRNPATPAQRHPRHSDGVAVSTQGGGSASQNPRQNATQDVLKTSTTRPTTSSSAIAARRPDVEEVCELLAEWIVENGSKPPTITKAWRDAARLMIDNDGRSVDQIKKAIVWCQRDEFWRSNVLSMPTLRAKYDQLRLAAGRTEPRTLVAVNGHRAFTNPADQSVYDQELG